MNSPPKRIYKKGVVVGRISQRFWNSISVPRETCIFGLLSPVPSHSLPSLNHLGCHGCTTVWHVRTSTARATWTSFTATSAVCCIGISTVWLTYVSWWRHLSLNRNDAHLGERTSWTSPQRHLLVILRYNRILRMHYFSMLYHSRYIKILFPSHQYLIFLSHQYLFILSADTNKYEI